MVAKAGVAKDKAHELLSILALRFRVELWEGAAMLAVKLKAECIPTPEGSVSRRQAWGVACRCSLSCGPTWRALPAAGAGPAVSRAGASDLNEPKNTKGL